MIRINIPIKQSLQSQASTHIDIKVSNITLMDDGALMVTLSSVDSTGVPFNDNLLSSISFNLDGGHSVMLETIIGGIDKIIKEELIVRGVSQDKIEIL